MLKPGSKKSKKTKAKRPCPGNEVSLLFEITFYKEQVIVSPVDTRHECVLTCLQSHNEPIKIKPLDKEHDFKETNPLGAIATWAKQRALLSMVLGFVDAQFAAATHDLHKTSDQTAPPIIT